MMYEYDISVMMFIRNTSNNIVYTINALNKIDTDLKVEYIFLNDAKKYKHLNYVHEFVKNHPNARYIDKVVPARGLANSYNELLDTVKGKYCLYCNIGTTITNETLENTVKYFDTHTNNIVFYNLSKPGLNRQKIIKQYLEHFNHTTGDYKVDHEFALLDDVLSFGIRSSETTRFKIKKSHLLDDGTRVNYYHKYLFDIIDRDGKCGFIEESTYRLPWNYAYKVWYKKQGVKWRASKKRNIRKWRFRIQHLVSVFYSLFLPIDPNKVVFVSDTRKEMGGNLKNVYEYLTELGYDTKIEFKWDRRARRSFSEKFRLVRNLSTAKYIFLEDLSNAITHTHFRKKQEIVQLWHGPGAYKKFGYSRVATGEYDKKNIHKGYKKYTKASVSGPYIDWCYAEAFNIDKSKVKATGFPRTDDFFDESYKKQIEDNFYKEYPQLKDKKMILFAPTYRGRGIQDASYDFEKVDFNALYETYKDEYVFVIKWHGFLQNNIRLGKVFQPDYSKYEGFVYDLSDYRDINDLLIVCDTLITDYSSLIFDYVLLNKPIIYFAYDLNDYTGEGSRGLYFDFNEYVYGKVATDSKQLLEAIKSNDLMMDTRRDFYDKFMGECDGYSTEKTCKWVMGIDYIENKDLINPYKK